MQSLNLPFLSSPMGKGVISEDHPNCVGAARAMALSQADVILLVGVRLNWMFNFGLAFDREVKTIMVTISDCQFIHEM